MSDLPPVESAPRRAEPFASANVLIAPALTGILIILSLGAIHYAKQFLVPVVLAVLLFFVFMPLQRRMQRFGINSHLAAFALVSSLLIGIGAIFFLLSGPVVEVAQNLPDIMSDIALRLEAARDVMVAAGDSFRSSATTEMPDLRSAAGADSESDGEMMESDMLLSTAGSVLLYLSEAPAVVAQLFFAIILLFFLLSSSDVIYLKTIQSFDGFSDKRTALAALREVEQKLGGYLGTVTLINAGLGVCVGLTMWWLGMPVPLLFAVLAFVLNFIPFIGAVMGVALSAAVALLWFDTLFDVALVAGAFLLLTAIEGQLVTPAMLARRLQMNTALVVLCIAFWAWMWSFMGMVIAVPMLVAVRVMAEQIPSWRKFANLLSA
ncbi:MULTISPECIES: AI-2E family transporter [unclassified Yoonia]|uniref:AI-2E family transporter n=1 Tax=unclassified Yoonia TaxID=2629118 RepID=UPI002AFFB5F0|nr:MULTISPECIES: AI-2E family transporter [unclassified Yoonia]